MPFYVSAKVFIVSVIYHAAFQNPNKLKVKRIVERNKVSLRVMA